MEESEQPRPYRRATWIVAVLVVVFVLYPLSIGPAVVLANYAGNLRAGAMALSIIYFPVFMACRAAGHEQTLSDYIQWWAALTQ